MADEPSTLLICCGAIAREVVAVVRDNGWDHMDVQCLPARLHNDPSRLPDGIRAKIKKGRTTHDKVLVLYSDCGTGGKIDQVLEEEGVDSIGGSHCYEIFAGSEVFHQMMVDEPGTFFVTDFLARNFEKLVFKGLGLDRFPKLRNTYFGKYKRLVYLAQTENPEIRAWAEAAAEMIGLEFEMRFTGYGGFANFIAGESGCDAPCAAAAVTPIAAATPQLPLAVSHLKETNE
jgi:hypothetical protein